MSDLPTDQPLKIATYGGWTPSPLLEKVRKAELIVGFFQESDTTMVFASIAANLYPHVKVRRCFGTHSKYCIAHDWAYVGSSNLGTVRTEVGLIVEDKEILKELRSIHKELWSLGIPHKRSNTKLPPVHKLQRLLEVPL